MNCKVGARNGVYIITGRVNYGSDYRFKMRCTVCGRELERVRSSWRKYDLSKCMCDVMEKNARWSKRKILVANDEEYLYRCRQHFNARCRKYEKTIPGFKCDSFDDVLAAIGHKPDDTDLFTYRLSFKAGPHSKNKNMTIDNLEWKRMAKTKAISLLQEAYFTKSRSGLARQVNKFDASTTLDVFQASKDKLKVIRNSLAEDYKCFIGRTIDKIEVIDLFETKTSTGTYYQFTLKCKRCGATFTRTAHKFLKHHVRCPNLCNAKKHVAGKNSSVARYSAIRRQKEKMHMRRGELTTDQRLMFERQPM